MGEELAGLGVWLPVSTLAGMRLREAGVPIDALPLTPSELAAALESVAVLPAPLEMVPGPVDGARTSPAITVRGCSVRRGGRRGPVVVDGVDLAIGRGETVGVVGESGFGKTITAMSVLKLIPMPPGRVVAGQILWKGRDLVPLEAEEMRKIRAKEIAIGRSIFASCVRATSSMTASSVVAS